jgi:hypothetical protein
MSDIEEIIPYGKRFHIRFIWGASIFVNNPVELNLKETEELIKFLERR